VCASVVATEGSKKGRNEKENLFSFIINGLREVESFIIAKYARHLGMSTKMATSVCHLIIFKNMTLKLFSCHTLHKYGVSRRQC
jgi:hypothetical protein